MRPRNLELPQREIFGAYGYNLKEYPIKQIHQYANQRSLVRSLHCPGKLGTWFPFYGALHCGSQAGFAS